MQLRKNVLLYWLQPEWELEVRALLNQGYQANFISKPSLAQAIRGQFWVDDFFGGAETPAEAALFQKELSEGLSQYGFNLRKWNTNIPDRRSTNETAEGIDIKFKGTQKTLGITWQPHEDIFVFQFKLPPLGKNPNKTNVMCRFNALIRSSWLAGSNSGIVRYLII